MPNYDFHCEKCGLRFTLSLAIKDRESAKCPRCNNTEVNQLITSCSYNLGFGPHRVPIPRKINS